MSKIGYKSFEGRFTAKSPVTHGSDENFGNEQRLRTEDIRVVPDDGEVEVVEVPFISGNSLRGQFRDLLAKDFLDHLDVEIHDTLSNALYSGGTLQRGTGGRKIKREMIQNVRENIPMLSLIGTALGTQMIQGKLNMGDLLPIAAETSLYTGVESDLSVFESVDMRPYTRMDDREGVVDRDQDEQAQQMMYKVQVLIRGTEFHHGMTLEHATEIEEACLYRAFELFRQSPYIGGMKGKGHGKVEFEYEGGLGSSAPYTEWLDENREDIREFVLQLDEKLED